MLVLTRRPQRGAHSIILIGSEITLEVLESKNGNVRLGITAPLALNISSSSREPCGEKKENK